MKLSTKWREPSALFHVKFHQFALLISWWNMNISTPQEQNIDIFFLEYALCPVCYFVNQMEIEITS